MKGPAAVPSIPYQTRHQAGEKASSDQGDSRDRSTQRGAFTSALAGHSGCGGTLPTGEAVMIQIFSGCTSGMRT
jgi:hypothetical protein